MPTADDWRLTNQEGFLQGATLHWAHWSRHRPDWDHDHCVFCWSKFMEEKQPDALHAGYTTADSYYWICSRCFDDFKDRFAWRLA
jgi:hypothetical protein